MSCNNCETLCIGESCFCNCHRSAKCAKEQETKNSDLFSLDADVFGSGDMFGDGGYGMGEISIYEALETEEQIAAGKKSKDCLLDAKIKAGD